MEETRRTTRDSERHGRCDRSKRVVFGYHYISVTSRSKINRENPNIYELKLKKYVKFCLKKEIASELRTIFDLIVKMSILKEDCQKLATAEFDARQEFARKISECTHDIVSLEAKFSFKSNF